MTLNFINLFVALAVLYFPRSFLRLGKRVTPRRKNIGIAKAEREFGDLSLNFKDEFRSSRNWVDLLRGYAGSMVLLYAAGEIRTEYMPDMRTDTFNLIMVALIGIGVLLQMFRFEGRVTMFAPAFYVQGIGFGVLGGKVGLLAWIAIWAINPIMPSAAAFLACYGGISFCLGLLLRHDIGNSAIVVCCGLLPPVISILLKRRLTPRFDKKLKVVSGTRSNG